MPLPRPHCPTQHPPIREDGLVCWPCPIRTSCQASTAHPSSPLPLSAHPCPIPWPLILRSLAVLPPAPRRSLPSRLTDPTASIPSTLAVSASWHLVPAAAPAASIPWIFRCLCVVASWSSRRSRPPVHQPPPLRPFLAASDFWHPGRHGGSGCPLIQPSPLCRSLAASASRHRGGPRLPTYPTASTPPFPPEPSQRPRLCAPTPIHPDPPPPQARPSPDKPTNITRSGKPPAIGNR